MEITYKQQQKPAPKLEWYIPRYTRNSRRFLNVTLYKYNNVFYVRKVSSRRTNSLRPAWSHHDLTVFRIISSIAAVRVEIFLNHVL